MNSKPTPSQVRKLAARILGQLSDKIVKLDDLRETMHIDRRRCVARSYAAGPLMAMWLVDAGVLQFYDDLGNMLRTVNLSQHPQRQRKAA